MVQHLSAAIVNAEHMLFRCNEEKWAFVCEGRPE